MLRICRTSAVPKQNYLLLAPEGIDQQFTYFRDDGNPAIDQSGSIASSFFGKTDDAITRIHVDRSVPARVFHPNDSHRCYGAGMFSMRADQVLEVDFEKRVSVKHQKIGDISNIALGQL